MIEPTFRRMMEEAELEAHADAWQPSETVSEDMDAKFRCVLVMLTTGRAPQIISTTAKRGASFQIPCTKVQPADTGPISGNAAGDHALLLWVRFDHALTQMCHLGGYGRCVKRRRCRRSSGEVCPTAGGTSGFTDWWRANGAGGTRPPAEKSWGHKSSVPYSWRVPSELRTHLLLTCGSRPDYTVMRQIAENYSVARSSLHDGRPPPSGATQMEIDAAAPARSWQHLHLVGPRRRMLDSSQSSKTITTDLAGSLHAYPPHLKGSRRSWKKKSSRCWTMEQRSTCVDRTTSVM